MSRYYDKSINSNELLNQIFATTKKSKKKIEQQDNESLNTMDYYKEENSSKDQALEENKVISKKILEKFQNINSQKEKEKSISPFIMSQSLTDKNIYEIYENQNFSRTSSFFGNENGRNVKNRFEDRKIDNDICSRCNSEIENSINACPHCLTPLCRKCLKDIFNRNLDNNDDIDNFDQNLINEKMCPNCRNLMTIKDFIVPKSKRESHNLDLLNQPLDTEINNIVYTLKNENEKNAVLLKDFDEQNNKYIFLLKKIEENKKELEVKKNLNLNILEMIRKAIEYEFNLNSKKLNEISLKLNQIYNSVINKKNQITQQNSFYNTIELKNLILKFRNSMNIFSKKYENLNQKLMIRCKPKAYKNYESNLLSINLPDTYIMKNTEILSNKRIGKAFVKIDRFINNYEKYLNFAVSIQPNNNNSQNSIKSKIIVHMIINNKLIKLNKANKNNNKFCLNYECSLEESKVFYSKNHSNNLKKYDNSDIKFVISEIFL